MSLKIIVTPTELFNEKTQEFIQLKKQTIVLEHSLVSISKWESKWKKPYFGMEPKTFEESIDYLRCMTITQNVDPLIYRYLTSDVYKKIEEYIDDPMTATIINDPDKSRGRSFITNELVYYWMTVFNIPFECEKWHFNRLLTLIKVCEMKQRDPKKMSKREILRNNSILNEERLRKYNTKG